jgi:Flp pilus assembly protein TadD
MLKFFLTHLPIVLLIAGCVTGKRELGESPVVLYSGVEGGSTANAGHEKLIYALAAGSAEGAGALEISYPVDGSVFPPEFIPPTVLWEDSSGADHWLIDIELDPEKHLFILTGSPHLPPPEIDSAAIPDNGRMDIPDPNRYRNWTPDSSAWETIKKFSRMKTVSMELYGFRRDQPDDILSTGRVTLMTSGDSVGAPIFYRDVPLMPIKNQSGKIMPLDKATIKLISLRLRDVSRPRSRLVLKGMYTCSNCHSFSNDGTVMGMDIDGPQSDKGSYGIVPLEKRTLFTKENMISWNYDFKDKPRGKKTIGFLSSVSPDGKYVVTTVNEDVYVVNYLDVRYIQVFFPTRGVLAYYSRETGEIKTIPGADDSNFVHCDPLWSPDGKEIVFARAPARATQVKGQKKPVRANDVGETLIQYSLYRIPFNGGKGGTAVPIAGASHNGVSNNFAKVTPDGNFIVFVKCRNGQLMRPDSRLWIVPYEGGTSREMRCNTREMNSWHSFSPSGRWMVFSSKANTHYTQLFLTHIDKDGIDSPPILLPNSTAANRAANIPEFVNIDYDDLQEIDMPAVKHMRYIQATHELLRNNKPREAIALLERSLVAQKEDINYCAEVLVLLAIIEREPSRAIKRLKEAIKTDPDYPLAYLNLGIMYEKQGNHAAAVSNMEKAVEMEPRNQVSIIKLAQTYMTASDPEIRNINKAVQLGEKASSLAYESDGSILIILARAYSESGQYKQAADAAVKALEFAKQEGDDLTARNLKREIALYKAGRPFSTIRRR